MYTPLHAAAASGQISVVRLLLELGVETDAVNAYGNTPLHIACLNGQDVVVSKLLEYSASLNAVNNKHMVSFFWIVKSLCHYDQFSTIVYFKTRGHLFFKISRFILGVEQPYFACPSESVCPNWGFNLGFCSSAVKKFFKKSLLKICILCELDF